jgi:isopentenyldiphosphate isomerase
LAPLQEDAQGVKNAARRKLEHELGIPLTDVPYESFTWLTRVHYVGQSIAPLRPRAGSQGSPGSDLPGCDASPEVTHSHADSASLGNPCSHVSAPTDIWGEHEIDWILVCKPEKLPTLHLNSNEVAAVRCFTQQELKEWMRTRHARGEEVSPWFGLMEQSGLVYKWWDAVLGRNGLHLKHPDVMQRNRIFRQHELEACAVATNVPLPQPAIAASKRLTEAGKAPAPSRRSVPSPGKPCAATALLVPPGGRGKLEPSAAPKQGAYGKVMVHTESLFAQLSHLDELWAALCYKFNLGKNPKNLAGPLAPSAPESLVSCPGIERDVFAKAGCYPPPSYSAP